MKKNPKILTEVFIIDLEQGAAATLVHLQKPGYRMSGLIRKGTKCTITYEKEDRTD